MEFDSAFGPVPFTIGQSAPNSFGDNPLTTGLTSPIDVSPGHPITGFQSQSLGGPFMLSLDFPDFNAFIDLLSTQGNTRVLSSLNGRNREIVQAMSIDGHTAQDVAKRLGMTEVAVRVSLHRSLKALAQTYAETKP